MGKNNTIVLITGSSSGIGKATARLLADNGYIIYGTSRRIPMNTIREDSKNVFMINMDVTEEESVNSAINAILKKEGRLDVLVNNAGISIQGPLEELSMDEIKQVFETNYFGALRTCRIVLPIMRKQASGCIINISSLAGQIGIPFDGGYGSSKFALEGMTEALSMEAKPFGIKVVIVEPGDVDTGMSARSTKARNTGCTSAYDVSLANAVRATKANERKGVQPEKVARTIASILKKRNPRMRYISGSSMDVMSIIAKRIIPSRIFENIVMKNYNL
jgi:NAD(P)-dependent dehydrogenase (short-subunit alcohol dehydrogenase family)